MKIIKRGTKPVEIPGAHRGTWECIECNSVIEFDGYENRWAGSVVTKRGIWPFTYSVLFTQCPVCIEFVHMTKIENDAS